MADNNCCNLNQPCKRQGLQEEGQHQRVKFQELEPCAVQALHELVSSVHDRVNISDQNQSIQSTAANDPSSKKNEYDLTLNTNIFSLEDDAVAKIIWNLDPTTLQDVLLAMVVSMHSFIKLIPSIVY